MEHVVEVVERPELLRMWKYTSGVSLPDVIVNFSEKYQWCSEHIKYKWRIDTDPTSYMDNTEGKFRYFFEDSKDAMLFKLRWC